VVQSCDVGVAPRMWVHVCAAGAACHMWTQLLIAGAPFRIWCTLLVKKACGYGRVGLKESSTACHTYYCGFRPRIQCRHNLLVVQRLFCEPTKPHPQYLWSRFGSEQVTIWTYLQLKLRA
jgi:hypothetical protein